MTAEHRAARSALPFRTACSAAAAGGELHLAMCTILQWSCTCRAACYKPPVDVCRALGQTSNISTFGRTEYYNPPGGPADVEVLPAAPLPLSTAPAAS